MTSQHVSFPRFSILLAILAILATLALTTPLQAGPFDDQIVRLSAGDTHDSPAVSPSRQRPPAPPRQPAPPVPPPSNGGYVSANVGPFSVTVSGNGRDPAGVSIGFSALGGKASISNNGTVCAGVSLKGGAGPFGAVGQSICRDPRTPYLKTTTNAGVGVGLGIDAISVSITGGAYHSRYLPVGAPIR